MRSFFVGAVVITAVVACRSPSVTCGEGTREEKGICVVDTARSSPTAKPGVRTGDGTLAVALVINGWELWIGNDQEVPQLSKDDPSRYPGILIDLRSAIDRHKLAEAGPAGSLGMVITYAEKPVIRVPMGPLRDLTGSKLGTQTDYFGTTGVELVSAIRLALAELNKTRSSRRALIVLGDGSDTNTSLARAQLRELAELAAHSHVETFAIVYKSKLSADSTVVTELVPNARHIADTREVDAAVEAIVARLSRP